MPSAQHLPALQTPSPRKECMQWRRLQSIRPPKCGRCVVKCTQHIMRSVFAVNKTGPMCWSTTLDPSDPPAMQA
jgi:hypothetical protein